MKYLYRYFCLFCLFFVFAHIIAVSVFSLENVVSWWIDIMGMSDKYKSVNLLIESIPQVLVLAVLVLLLLCALLALYKQKQILEWVNQFLSDWKKAFVNLFKDIRNKDVLIVVFIPFLMSIYFANTIAVSYDEAITYNLFTSKPFYYCMIFYPYPNNHVFHSLLTNLTEYIPFINVLFGLRVPAILASLLTNLILYSFLKKYYSSRVALLVVGLCSAMYLSIYYSFMSRGYAFMVLAFVVCLYAAFNIINRESKNKDWMFFVVAGILGCYTIPSFLYPLITVNVLIFIYNNKNVRQQLFANLIIGVIVIILYSPIMIVDGIASLTSNQFVQHIDRLDIFRGIANFYKGMFVEISTMSYSLEWIILILLFSSFFLAIYQRNRFYVVLWLLFMIAPFVLLMVHAVHPFYRTFLYYNCIMAFLLIVPLKKYLERIPQYVILLSIVVIQLLGFYNFNNRITTKEGFNTYAKIIADTYFKKENTIVFPCIASSNYEFEAKVKGLEDKIHFLNNVAASADSINNADFVILEESRDKTIEKVPYAKVGAQNIYKNKN